MAASKGDKSGILEYSRRLGFLTGYETKVSHYYLFLIGDAKIRVLAAIEKAVICRRIMGY